MVYGPKLFYITITLRKNDIPKVETVEKNMMIGSYRHVRYGNFKKTHFIELLRVCPSILRMKSSDRILGSHGFVV